MGGIIKYMIYINENVIMKSILLYSKCMLISKKGCPDRKLGDTRFSHWTRKLLLLNFKGK